MHIRRQYSKPYLVNKSNWLLATVPGMQVPSCTNSIVRILSCKFLLSCASSRFHRANSIVRIPSCEFHRASSSYCVWIPLCKFLLSCVDSIVRILSCKFHRASSSYRVWILLCGFYRANSIVRVLPIVCESRFHRANSIVRAPSIVCRFHANSIVQLPSRKFFGSDFIVVR